jgi:hypothetical protein
MLVEYKASKRRKQEKRKIACIEKGETLVDDITVWNDSIRIPRLPATGLGRCRLIDVKYELEFRAVIDGGSQPIVVSKEIYIGTVPLCLREMRTLHTGTSGIRHSSQSYATAAGYSPSVEHFQEFPPSCYSPMSDMSHVSLTDLIAATVASTAAATMNPSAPLLVVFDGSEEKQQPVDEDRPPPFAPGHEMDDRIAQPADVVPLSTATSSSCCLESSPPYNPSFVAVHVHCSTDNKEQSTSASE